MARAFRAPALALVASIITLTACGDGGSGTPEPDARPPDARPNEEVRSELERATPTAADRANARALAASNASFGFDLLRQLASEAPGNLLLSPFSVSLAFAMLYGGARGDTATEMAEVLRFDLPDEDLHAAFNATTRDLERCDDDACLALANAMWQQRGETYVPEFLDLLALYYDAGMHVVDFSADPEAARLAINAWVAERTEGHIPEIVPPGIINLWTRFVLANAIFFRASWAKQFNGGLTEDGPFTRRDGTERTVPRMNQIDTFRYVRDGTLQALELPYYGTDLAMVVLLPDPGQQDAVLAGLDGESLRSILAGLSSATVAVTLPSFELASTFNLNEHLMAMGMIDAFGGADFTGAMPGGNVAIQAALHQAWIKTDEKGTEAAASTVIIVGGDAGVPVDTGVPEIIPFVVDRPFLFVIRDRVTGAVLFLGKVEDPSM
jgi:serpin B